MARTRRAFLGAVGAAAVAGCSARAPRREPAYRLSVRVLEGAEAHFEYTATVRREAATLVDPMVFRSTYENPRGAGQTEEFVAERTMTVLSRDSGAPGASPAIALLDPDTGYEQRHPGCWTPDTDYVGVLLASYDFSDLSPGTTVHLDHAVWQNPPALEADEHCLQPGTFRVTLGFGLGVELEVTVTEP